MRQKGSLLENGLYGCLKSSGDDAEGQGAYAAILKKCGEYHEYFFICIYIYGWRRNNYVVNPINKIVLL